MLVCVGIYSVLVNAMSISTNLHMDRLQPGESLELLYEKFNIAHPADYTGHSLSVSDIVVLNYHGDVKAYFVDSLSFLELTDFMLIEQMEKAVLVEQEILHDVEIQVSAVAEYKPLAKVEELEEAN